jgi:hypothetical protein
MSENLGKIFTNPEQENGCEYDIIQSIIVTVLTTSSALKNPTFCP